MAIRDIVVCLDPSIAGEGRLKLAVGLARAHQARLTGAYVVSPSLGGPGGVGFGPLPPAGTDGLLGAAADTAAAAPREAERAEQAEQRFSSELRLCGIDGEWHLLDDGDAVGFIELAKSADLAIVGQRPTDARADGAARLRPDDILVELGRPVLVVPYAGSFEMVGRRALAAWDGTREANRALNDALPLIAEAEAVTVIYVGTQETSIEWVRPALERMVRHLRRHGIAAHPEESLRGDMAVSDLLLSRAADLDADMIVAGAYHHSKLREALLGGVSRELLQHMTVPLLMSH